MRGSGPPFVSAAECNTKIPRQTVQTCFINLCMRQTQGPGADLVHCPARAPRSLAGALTCCMLTHSCKQPHTSIHRTLTLAHPRFDTHSRPTIVKNGSCYAGPSVLVLASELSLVYTDRSEIRPAGHGHHPQENLLVPRPSGLIKIRKHEWKHMWSRSRAPLRPVHTGLGAR